MIVKIYKHFMHSSLYRNSIFLMASSTFTAFFGFIFWILNARLFSTRDVGIATTLISTASFIGEFSILGLKNGLIRFLPQSETKNNKINTSVTIVSIVGLVLSLGFIVMTPVFSDKLTFLRNNIFYLIIFTAYLISYSLNQIQEGVFVAYRSTIYILVKNVYWGLTKITLPLFMISLGAFGIFTAFSIGGLISLLFGFYILIKNFEFKPKLIIDILTVRQIGKFSIGDYLGAFFSQIPNFILPLIIINRLGAEMSAFYYIALQIAGFLFIIPVAVNQSLFAEGSHSENDTRVHLINSLKLTYMLLIPAIFFMTIFGKYILGIFGNHYSQNGIVFLQLLTVSGVFVAINQVGSALVHVQKRIKFYAIMNLLSATVTTLTSIALINYGLLGLGVAILIGTATASIFYLFTLLASLR